jgi:hypothetical protein
MVLLATCMTTMPFSGRARSVGGGGAQGSHYSNFPAEVLES